MKKIFFQLTLLIIVETNMADLCAQGGYLRGLTQMSATKMQAADLWFDFDSLDYVTGGVTFVFPVGAYASAPSVQVTIALKNATYNATVMYIPEITNISNLSTTVRVNKFDGSTLSEAATGDVTVYLYALGNQN